MTKTLIAMPSYDTMRTEFVKSFIDLIKPPGTGYAIITGTLIYDARNVIAQNALKSGFDRVLWLDTDMIIPPDAMQRLSAEMDTGKEFVSALYYGRKDPHNPIICDRLDWAKRDDGTIEAHATSYVDYPKDTVFQIEGAGFGCVMTSAKLLQDMVDRHGAPFTPLLGIGEDIAFCWRARQAGYTLYCDSRIRCGHIGTIVY